MSTTTTRTRKAPATKVAEAAAKAPAKPAAEKRAYQAQGRGGKVNTRSFSQVMTHAVDVADKDAKSAAAQAGLIWSFHTSEEKAQAQAAKLNAAGYDAKVVTAKAVTK